MARYVGRGVLASVFDLITKAKYAREADAELKGLLTEYNNIRVPRDADGALFNHGQAG